MLGIMRGLALSGWWYNNEVWVLPFCYSLRTVSISRSRVLEVNDQMYANSFTHADLHYWASTKKEPKHKPEGLGIIARGFLLKSFLINWNILWQNNDNFLTEHGCRVTIKTCTKRKLDCRLGVPARSAGFTFTSLKVVHLLRRGFCNCGLLIEVCCVSRCFISKCDTEIGKQTSITAAPFGLGQYHLACSFPELSMAFWCLDRHSVRRDLDLPSDLSPPRLKS